MKKQLITVGLLAALDQAVKLLILNFAMDARMTLIPNVIRFETSHNTNLNWIASMADIVMPVFLMVIIQLAGAAFITLFFVYSRHTRTSGTIGNPWLNLGYSTSMAGIVCSFIDVVFWGGSLDYVGLFNWFIFDMKDVFLNIGWIGIIIWINSKAYKSGDNSGISFREWIGSGCKPVKQKH